MVGFKYQVGDTLVPVAKNKKSHFLSEIVVDGIDETHFLYSVIDYEGESWNISPIELENEFVLKE